MLRYIIDAYKAFGKILILFTITVIFCSPLILGLVLGLVINKYWLWLMLGLIITFPMEIAFISWLVDGNHI